MTKTTPHMYSWMNPALTVRTTAKYGHGNIPVKRSGKKTYKNVSGDGNAIFARTDIPKNTMLFVMGGYILDIDDENQLAGIVADKPIEISEEFSIGPRKPSDLPRMPQHYVNHSCDPNAGFKGQIFMVARRKIQKGEEICFDYAMVMHSNNDSDSFFTFECLCGTKKCRQLITEDDWKRPELQQRYDGYFQYFIQEKINKKKK